MKKMLGGLLLFFAQVVVAQQPVSRVTFDPVKAQPGQDLSISYNPEGSSLAGKKDITGVVYTYENYVWHTRDLLLKEEHNQWKATLKLAKDCGFVAVKFRSGDLIDNNDNGVFAQMLVEPSGRNAAGAYAGWGLLRAPKFGYGVPTYFTKDTTISNEAIYFWINQETSFHPQEASAALSVPFASALFTIQGEKAFPRINRVVAYLKQNPTEENLLKALAISRYPLQNKTAQDSLEKVLLTTFPKGHLARLKAFQQANIEANFDKKVALFTQFLQDFPYKDTDFKYNEDLRINYTNSYLMLALQALMKKDYTQLTAIASTLPYAAIPTVYYKCIDIAHKRKDIDDQTLLAPSEAFMKRMESFKNQRPAAYWYLSPTEWTNEYEKTFLQSFALTQTSIYRTTEHWEEALALANRAQQARQFKSAELNNEQALLLEHFKQYSQLQDVLVKSMHENQSSPEMLELLKRDYQRAKGNVDGFETYIEGLKNPVLASRELEELKAIMIKKTMPDWTMKDGNGKTVKFSELRGKTIIMDFWATWCVPCKASFPGMKLAVEKYKNDPNVVFFFVDTEERSPTYKQEIMQYIKDNNYPFTILFDNKLPNQKANDEVFNRICKAFTISGIPQKLIIDKNGILRFITVGFKGSATGLADEISAMIELTKKAE